MYIGEQFEIIYLDSNISQIKTLVNHSEYEQVQTKKVELTSSLTTENKKPQKNKKLIEEFEEQLESVGKELSRKYGQFFTTKSPLGLALLNNSDLELPGNQGRFYKVVFRRI